MQTAYSTAHLAHRAPTGVLVGKALRHPTSSRSCSSSTHGGAALAPRALAPMAPAPAPLLLPPLAASRSSSPADDDGSDEHSATAADAGPSPSSQAGAAGAAAAAQQQQQQQQPDSPWLALPLLIISSFSHVNRQYIKMRRRRKWWSRLGGYPKVPSEHMDHLPEPAIELWHKVVPLGLIFFCASFNLTILQSLKDAIMVTAGGAEALPFLASFCVLPASVAFFVLYGKLVAHLPERAVFYTAVLPLLAYYGIFAGLLYPLAGSLHPLDLMHQLMPSVPTGLHGLLKVAGNWTYSLFFCTAELWGAVVISVLFWSLANEVCTVDEAKAVYPFMAIGANVALVAAGCYIRLVNHGLSTSLAGDTQLLSLRVLIATVMVMTGAMFASKAFIDTRILGPSAAAAEAAASAAGGGAAAGSSGAKAAGGKNKKKKSKGTFSEGLEVLRNSPKIRNLALLVMSYGVGHRLFEFAWKGQLRALYPTMQGYQSVLADVATYTGILTLASMVVSRLVFQYAGWGVAASVTPAVMGLAGVVFFGATLAAGVPTFSPESAAAMAGVGATAGVVTQVFARAAKYSLFDPAKEMVYIEMDASEKKQGKAAVDLVGSQIGKSGASWITQAFLLGCGSIAAAMPFTGVIFAGVIVTWIKATLELHNQMQATEKARLAEQQVEVAAASSAAAAAAVAAAANASHALLTSTPGQPYVSAAPTPAGSSTSSMDGDGDGDASSSSTTGALPPNGHTVTAANGHANGASSSSSSYSKSGLWTGGGDGGEHSAAALGGANGAPQPQGGDDAGAAAQRELSKVKMQ